MPNDQEVPESERAIAMRSLERVVGETTAGSVGRLVQAIVDEALNPSKVAARSVASIRGNEVEWADEVTRGASQVIDVGGKRYVEVDLHNAIIRDICAKLGAEQGENVYAAIARSNKWWMTMLQEHNVCEANKRALEDLQKTFDRFTNDTLEVSHALGQDLEHETLLEAAKRVKGTLAAVEKALVGEDTNAVVHDVVALAKSIREEWRKWRDGVAGLEPQGSPPKVARSNFVRTEDPLTGEYLYRPKTKAELEFASQLDNAFNGFGIMARSIVEEILTLLESAKVVSPAATEKKP
jgi:hypothetical protein